MAVKIVSTLNAVINLLKKGYIQEIGILLRVVDECNAKILCIEEAHVKQTLTSEQKKTINEYFQFDIRKVEDVFSSDKWWVNMNKVFASQARFLSEGTPNKDICSILEKCKIIYNVFTGYVHGFYPHVMELYDMDQKKFRISGLPKHAHDEGMFKAVASAVLRAFNIFAQLAARFNLSALREELIKKRNIFMESEAYKEQK